MTIIGGQHIAQAKHSRQSLDSAMVNTVKSYEDSIELLDPSTGNKKRFKLHFPAEENNLITYTSELTFKTLDSVSSKKINKKKSYSRPIFGLTFSRVDFGLTKPMQDGGFKLNGENEIFKYRPSKTWNFGFDVLQVGYRFNKHFRTFLSAGFDWTYYRLNKSYIFDPEESPYESHSLLPETLRKNKLTSTYLRLPLTFEFRGKHNSYAGRTNFAFGPIGGFLLKGTQRYKLPDGKKIKEKGDYDFTPFQYGAFARFGVGDFGIYGKYYFNDVFANSPQNTNLNNFTFGIYLGF